MRIGAVLLQHQLVKTFLCKIMKLGRLTGLGRESNNRFGHVSKPCKCPMVMCLLQIISFAGALLWKRQRIVTIINSPLFNKEMDLTLKCFGSCLCTEMIWFYWLISIFFFPPMHFFVKFEYEDVLIIHNISTRIRQCLLLHQFDEIVEIMIAKINITICCKALLE